MPQPLCFGHFEVQTRSDGSPLVLGRGAMGVTYKAFDRVLLSPAVVKVPSSEHQMTPEGRQRFLKEAQMLARVRHPHIASVFFFGDSPSGVFFAMEHCEGPNLADYIAQVGPLDWKDVFSLGAQAASALQALAEHDLVHRDLKPSNFVLTRDAAGNAFLKLIDFGIAREGLRADSDGFTLGGFMGTPAYASPEQLLEAADLDSRSDLYSLGSVLWFCLTGKPPFEGTQFEVMFHHANTQPDWRKLPAIPEPARGVLARLLAKSPDERFASPSALFTALQAVLEAGADTGKVRLRLPEKAGTGDFGGYEPIEEVASDPFGKVWRARDTLTGNIVSLRLLPGEFCSKTTLVLRVDRLVALLRGLDHPRWQRVWHFEHNETQGRLALEWVDGPTVLSLLKARQNLPLAEALPLLAQVAEAMDFAAMQGLPSVELAPERLSMEVQGWSGMDDAVRSTILRQPLSEWRAWTVKVCPLGLSKSGQDYLLPSDSGMVQAALRLNKDFILLCYRLLTGQAQGARGFVPHSALKAATNAFFEKQLEGSDVQTTCGRLLRDLCLCEELPPPATQQDDFGRAIARSPGGAGVGIETPAATAESSGISRATSPTSVSAASPESPAVPFPTGQSPQSTSGGPAISSPAAISRLRELEIRRAKLESDAELLKAEESLNAEREWLSQEKQALDGARNDFAVQEARRKEQLSEEQKQVEAMRQALAGQQALLEEKQAEQQRLEQEIQSRAQIEFHRLQNEAEALKSELASRDAKLAEALHQREAEFRAREEKNLARVEELRKEADALQRRLQEEAATLRNSELRQSRRSVQEEAADSLARETLAAEERRLDALRGDLDVRLAQWERGRKKRKLALLIGVPIVILLAGIAAYFIKGRIVDFARLPGEQQWQAALDQSKRAQTGKNWIELLNWCVVTDESLRAKPEFSESLKKHQRELAAFASEAIQGLLGEKDLPDVSGEQGRKLLLNLEKTAQWNLPPARALLLAKLRMPEAVARGAGAEALNAYLAATNADPESAGALRKELEAAFRGLREQLRSRRLDISGGLSQLVGDVIKVESGSGGMESNRFHDELRAEEARRKGQPGEALRILLDTLELNPGALEALRPQALEILAQVVKLPAPELLPLASVLRSAGDTWKSADAYLALADTESDEKARIDDYKRADLYGSMRARAMTGRALLDSGVENDDPAQASQGAAKLREAVAAGEAEAMVLLGEALYAGRGVPEDAAEALDLATRAESKGHAEAFFLAAKARLRLGEISRDPAQFAEAAKGLEKAVAKNLQGAPYLLYVANHNEVVRNPAQALAALEKGALVRDQNCLFFLGWWLYNGQSPAERNQTRGRELINEASKAGSEQALKWLQEHPL